MIPLAQAVVTATASADPSDLKAKIIAGVLGLLAIVGYTVARAAPGLVDVILAGVKSRLARWAARQRIAELEAERDKARLEADESRRIKVTLIDSVASGLEAISVEAQEVARAAMKSATAAAGMEGAVDREVKRRTVERAAVKGTEPERKAAEEPKP